MIPVRYAITTVDKNSTFLFQRINKKKSFVNLISLARDVINAKCKLDIVETRRNKSKQLPCVC